MTALLPKPAVVESGGFNAEEDATTLRQAMKGMGTDEEAIIKVLTKRSYPQIEEITKKFQQLFGRVLKDDLKSELSGKLEDTVLKLLLSPSAMAAHTIRDAVKGLGTNEMAIIEIVCTCSNSELSEIKAEYKRLFDNRDMMKDITDDLSGDLKRLVVSMSTGDRDESPDLDDGDAAGIAQKLYDAGEGRLGTNEEMWNVVFGSRSFEQIKKISEAYQKMFNHEHGIIGAIKSEFSGDIKNAYLAIATTALEGREAYFADLMYGAMKGLGTSDQQLIRLVTWRSQLDLKGVAVRFMQKNGKPLENWIIDPVDNKTDDCSGDYGRCLLELVKGNLD